MRIAIAGSSGFLGTALKAALAARGDEAAPLRRDGGDWAPVLEGAAAVVNLAGANIASGRWTARRKALILGSRVETTRRLVEALGRCARRPSVLVNASAVGYYGDAGDAPVAEDAPAGGGFLASVCQAWEAEADGAAKHGARVVKARLGVVLGPGGGALPRMALPFRLFLGGPLGSGRQWLSWVSLEDAVAAILFALDRSDLSGPVNVVSPLPVTNAEFSAALGRALGRPCWLPAPAFALRLALGEMADMLLGGQRAAPRRLEAAGFRFSRPLLADALK
jgi:hypothetical protein